MAEVSKLIYPNRSHRKKVTLPEPSIELAEFFGIMMGDGGINNDWQFNITLNALADAAYIPYVSQLIVRLFGVPAKEYKVKTRSAYRFIVSSVSVVDYLVKLGLIRGDKLRGGLAMPQWIRENSAYRIACVRGLMDTDGCLYIHKHMVARKEYNNIGLCFCSYSPVVISQVSSIFEEFGIIPHISNHGRSIYLYKASAVKRYLEVFGTSNDRIRSVYEKFGGVA